MTEKVLPNLKDLEKEWAETEPYWDYSTAHWIEEVLLQRLKHAEKQLNKWIGFLSEAMKANIKEDIRMAQEFILKYISQVDLLKDLLGENK